MPFSPSFTVAPGEAPPFTLWQRLCAYVDGQTRKAGKPLAFDLALTRARRSTKANALCWKCYERISEHYAAGGQPVTKEGLHMAYKERFLPIVAHEAREATGEDVDYEMRHLRPDGRAVVTLTTTRLSPFAFSLFMQMVDMAAGRVGCDLSDLLDPENLRAYKSGSVEDRGTDEVPYVSPEPGVYVIADDPPEASAASPSSQSHILEL